MDSRKAVDFMSTIESKILSRPHVRKILKSYVNCKFWISSNDMEQVKQEPDSDRKSFLLYLQYHVREVDLVLSKLTEKERQIIKKCYLEDDSKLDPEVQRELKMSRSNFYNHKKMAFMKLAIHLPEDLRGDIF